MRVGPDIYYNNRVLTPRGTWKADGFVTWNKKKRFVLSVFVALDGGETRWFRADLVKVIADR